jgi:hypothetical protein
LSQLPGNELSKKIYVNWDERTIDKANWPIALIEKVDIRSNNRINQLHNIRSRIPTTTRLVERSAVEFAVVHVVPPDRACVKLWARTLMRYWRRPQKWLQRPI